MSVEQRLIRVEDAFVNLTKLAQTVDGRLDEIDQGLTSLADAQENSERKIAALVDAQLKTEGALVRLAKAQESSEHRIAQLADLQARTEGRLQELSDLLRHIQRGEADQ